MFEIEKGIPIPEKGRRGRGYSKYPISEMEPGDSFFVPCEETEAVAKTKALRAALAKKKGRRFVVRKVDGGCRVWLTQIIH